MGAPGPHRGAGGLVVLRPSLKRVVPGAVPPWRAPCFAWPCRGFWLPGVFSWLCRGFLLPAARNCGAASKVASRSAIFSCKSRQAAPADDVVRRHADFLQCSNRSVFLRRFARCLLPATRAHGCCCPQPFASRRARLFLPHGFHRAPPNSVF